MSGRVRVGCSGWIYKEWRGRFYPRDLATKHWFRYYADRFDTVEINNSFYRLPTEKAAEGWKEQAPPGFVYAMKVGQFGTHRKKLNDPGPWLANHLDRMYRLGAHLGPNLLQLPPRWKRNVERLDEFLSVAPPDIRWAVEMRDESWLHDDVFDVLQRHGAALCIHDLLPKHPWLLTTDWTYVRFHGADALRRPYHGAYGGRGLRPAVDRLGDWVADGVDVYAYFNNDVNADAPVDAALLRDRLHAAKAA